MPGFALASLGNVATDSGCVFEEKDRMIAAQCHYVFVLVCIFAADAIAQTPRPAANPRQNVFGVYSVRQRVGAGDMSARCVKEGDCIAALLLVGENDVGWFVQSDGSGEPLGQIPFPAWPVCNFSANNAGQLLLDVCGGGEGAYDGFQTDDGLFVRTETRLSTGEALFTDIVAAPLQLPLSNPTGLYSVSVRTTFYSGNRSVGDYTDWQGTAAVVVGRQYVNIKPLYVALYLNNTHGGSTRANLRGALKSDSSFVLESNDSLETYTGFLRPGRLIGTWQDIRGNDRFEGTLVARRR